MLGKTVPLVVLKALDLAVAVVGIREPTELVVLARNASVFAAVPLGDYFLDESEVVADVVRELTCGGRARLKPEAAPAEADLVSVLVDHRRAAAKRVIRISALRAVGKFLLQHLAERVALERLGKSVLVNVRNRATSAVVGNGKRSKRLASVEALHAGDKPGIVVCVLRHDPVCVRHADGRVEGIVANLCYVSYGVFHRNREARLVIGDLRLTASVVHRRDVALSVAGKARRDRRSAVGVQERDRDGLASLGV